MNFLNPLALVALAATLVPLLLHFLTLRKPRPFPFSSLRFLKELQRSTARRFRLRQLLLLAVRMALIASIVLAFAQPVIPGKIPLVGTRAPASVVLIVDNSASMGIADVQGERFRRLQQYAERLIRSLSAEDEVAIVPVIPNAPAQAEGWDSPRGEVLRLLSALNPQPSQGNLSQALQRAALLLNRSSHAHRFVLVLSDFQRSALAEAPPEMHLFDGRTSVHAVDLGEAKLSRAVLVLDSVALETQLRALGEPVTVTVRVRAFGEGTAEAMIGLLLGQERVAQQHVALRAGERRTLTLTGTPLRPGFTSAVVIAEGDVAPIGERCFAGFAVPEPFPVGVITNEAARPFIEAALSAFPAQVLPFQPQVLSSTALEAENLSAFRVLVIATDDLREVSLQRIEAFLRAGGGVVLFAAGGQSADLLPRWLARFGLTAQQRSFPPTQPATVTWADKHHPLFAGVFIGESDGERLPETPRLERLMLLSGTVPLLRSSAGAVLAEQRIGQGHLFFCGLAVDPTWGDFPRSGLFPIFLVRAVLLAGPAAAPVFFRSSGEQVALTLPTSADAFTVREPNGSRRTVPSLPLSSGTRIELGQLRDIGTYELATLQGAPVATVNANLPAAELQLEHADQETIAAWFRQVLSPAASFRYIPSPEKLLSLSIEGTEATELWQYCLGLALILAAVEVALSRRLRKDETTPPP